MTTTVVAAVVAFALVASPSRADTTLALLEPTNPGVFVRPHDAQRFIQVTGSLVLNVGDAVRTDATGRALITYSDGTTLVVEPGTELVIEAIQQTNGDLFVLIRQTAGRVWYELSRNLAANSRYEVRSGALAMVVRAGSTVEVAVADDGTTTITATQGSAEASGGGATVTVTTGTTTTAAVGATPAPLAPASATPPPAPTPQPAPSATPTPAPTSTPITVVAPLPLPPLPVPAPTASPTAKPNRETATPAPTATPVATDTPEPTAKPEPTPTPDPTAKPDPTSAPTPTASPTPSQSVSPKPRHEDPQPDSGQDFLQRLAKTGTGTITSSTSE